jgi:hypothetical protein
MSETVKGQSQVAAVRGLAVAELALTDEAAKLRWVHRVKGEPPVDIHVEVGGEKMERDHFGGHAPVRDAGGVESAPESRGREVFPLHSEEKVVGPGIPGRRVTGGMGKIEDKMAGEDRLSVTLGRRM